MTRWCRALLAIAVLVGTTGVGLAAPASAATTCDLTSVDSGCTFTPLTVDTPLGTASVSVGLGNVVTVKLTPTDPTRTRVYGVPFIPSDPVVPWITRTSIPTVAGTVNIDTVRWPSNLFRWLLPNLALVSLQVPGNPVRVQTVGTTVIFTPIV